MATQPMQIRLTDLDREKLAVIQEVMGLSFVASAVRYSIHRTFADLESSRPTKKNPKKSKKGD